MSRIKYSEPSRLLTLNVAGGQASVKIPGRKWQRIMSGLPVVSEGIDYQGASLRWVFESGLNGWVTISRKADGNVLKHCRLGDVQVQALSRGAIGAASGVIGASVRIAVPRGKLTPTDGRGRIVVVPWAYDTQEIALTARNWQRVLSGRSLEIRGRGQYDGEAFWTYWTFEGGLAGRLHVGYEDCGVGFDGILAEADFYRTDGLDGDDCPAVTYRGEQSEISPKLRDAYQRTVFEVLEPMKFVLRASVPSHELVTLYRQWGHQSAAVVTACNPFSAPQSAEQNRKQMLLLDAQIRAIGLAPLAAAGRDREGKWPPEESLLVLGLDLQPAVRLGVEFGQNAVLWAGSDYIPRIVLLR